MENDNFRRSFGANGPDARTRKSVLAVWKNCFCSSVFYELEMETNSPDLKIEKNIIEYRYETNINWNIRSQIFGT